ncbi:MAG: glycosyltransferase, partial [Verrucomicrobiota bacterium]
LIDSRMGLIVEEFGGGFKLKTLEYIFHGLPLAGLDHAVEGLPLECPQEILLASDVEQLLSGVIHAIDDLDRLNQMRENSYAACQSAFDWKDRGVALKEAIEGLAKA